MKNLDCVKDIMNIIGSPFNAPQGPICDDFGTIQLYNIAKQNKIGLLFLESLAKQKQLLNDLQIQLNREREQKKILQTTAKRAAGILNTGQHKYVIIKSTYPFPAVPNDVDILFLGTDTEYRKAIDSMKAHYFQPVNGEAPLEICLHDRSRSQHVDQQLEKFALKDPFDVDMYRELGAGHIIYMNKNKLLDKVCELNIDNVKINVLTLAADLALNIFHSIYPERLYTLLLHLYVLYSVDRMTRAESQEFLQVCQDHKIQNAVVAVLTLTEILEERSFGESPSKVSDLKEAICKRDDMHIRMDKMPFLYSKRIVMDSFWGKKSDVVFVASLMKQILSMLNPRYFSYVLKVHKDRAKRDTY